MYLLAQTWKKTGRYYRKLFSIEEIESTPVLQWVFGALILSSFITFYNWIETSAITKEVYKTQDHVCWSYFQSCGEYYFLSTQPYGFSQSIWYVFLFSLLTYSVYLMSQKRWVRAHGVFSLVFLWKFLVVFVLSANISGNYDYYDLALAIPFLFFPCKLFFVRLVFVLLYFWAATAKIHEGWVLGTYFTSLKLGLPIFSDAITPLITNFVIGLQIVGAWFLLSANKLYQRTALLFFLTFHVYSGFLVHYRYITTAIPMLLILFGPFNQVIQTPLSRKSLFGWGFVALLTVLQLSPYMIAGDQKMSQEGNRYGLYMFDANHQCRSESTIVYQDGNQELYLTESWVAQVRCNPYDVWFKMKEKCRVDNKIQKIGMTFDHSINGGPFYRIVDVENVCALEYRPFRHNDWIQLPKSGAPIVGYPVENRYTF